jgi:hypothetical protein
VEIPNSFIKVHEQVVQHDEGLGLGYGLACCVTMPLLGVLRFGIRIAGIVEMDRNSTGWV